MGAVVYDANSSGGAAGVLVAELIFTREQLQALAGIGESKVIPPFNVEGGIPGARLCGPVCIELLETFEAPGLTAVDLQVVQGGATYGDQALTGVVSGLLPPGFWATPPPAQLDALSPGLPQLQILLTGATFADLTAGSVRVSFTYAVA